MKIKKTPHQIAASIAAKAADEIAAQFSHPAEAEAYGVATFDEVFERECRIRGIDPVYPE